MLDTNSDSAPTNPPVSVAAVCVPPVHANTLAKHLAAHLPAAELVHLKRVVKLGAAGAAAAARLWRDLECADESPARLAVLLCASPRALSVATPSTAYAAFDLQDLPDAVTAFLSSPPFDVCARATVCVPREAPRCADEWRRYETCWLVGRLMMCLPFLPIDGL